MLDKFKINDNREQSAFKNISMTNYKINELVKLYHSNLINSKIDYSTNLLVELHSIGQLNKIIQTFIKVYFQNINIQNPYLFNYLMKKILYLEKLLNNYKKKEYILTRNNQEIRNLLVDINGLLTTSPKSTILLNKYLPKVKEDDYIHGIIKHNMSTRDFSYVDMIEYNEENSYMKIALNEIFYLLYYKKNLQKIYYWYLWVKKKNKKMDTFNSYIMKIINFKLDTLDKIKKDYIILLIQNYENKLFNKSVKENIIFIIFYVYLNDVNFYKNIFHKEDVIITMSLKINLYYQNLNSKLNPVFKFKENIFEKSEEPNVVDKKEKVITKKKEPIKKTKKKGEEVNEKINYKLELFNNLFS